MSREVQRLVVLGSTVTALAIVRSCHQRGLPCTLVDTRKDPATLTRLADVRVLSDHDDEAVLVALVKLASDENCALIADSDRWLRWLIQHRDTLGEVFQLILHPSNAVLETCLNKTRFIRWCKEKTFPAPEIYDVKTGDDYSSVEFPVLVRPELTRHGSTDDLPKAIEIADSTQLAALLKRYEELGATPNVCQSLLRPNVRQYSVGVACNETGGKRIFVAEKLRPAAAMCAGGTYVVASPDEQVASLVGDAAKKLGLFGIAEVEVMEDVDTGELFLLEVNARPWVQYALASSSGFDFLTFLLISGAYDPGLERYVGKRWLSFGDDLYVVFSRSEGLLKTKEITLVEYVWTVIRANVYSLWSFNDPLPWLASLKSRVRRLVRRHGHAASDH